MSHIHRAMVPGRAGEKWVYRVGSAGTPVAPSTEQVRDTRQCLKYLCTTKERNLHVRFLSGFIERLLLFFAELIRLNST